MFYDMRYNDAYAKQESKLRCNILKINIYAIKATLCDTTGI